MPGATANGNNERNSISFCLEKSSIDLGMSSAVLKAAGLDPQPEEGLVTALPPALSARALGGGEAVGTHCPPFQLPRAMQWAFSFHLGLQSERC